MIRPELRIIEMTQTEYNAAMKQFLGNDYEECKDNYSDYLMDDEFDFLYASGMEIAIDTPLHTQYYAAIINQSGDLINSRLCELPESFSPEVFKGWEDVDKFLDDERDDR